MDKDKALEQPEQEPVAWMDEYGDVLSASVVDGSGLRNIPLYTAPPHPKPEQEHVSYSGNGTAGREADVKPTGFFFQMPSQRTWVGLTNEEIDEAIKSCNTTDTYKYFRAIEAQLREKNGG